MKRFFRVNLRALALGFFSAIFMVGFTAISVTVANSVVANFTNHGAPKFEVLPNIENSLVLDVTIPDAFNGGVFTEDIIVTQGTNPIWQGDALNAFPALGVVDGVGYTNFGANGYQGAAEGEAVIIDHDADSQFTNAADTLVDGDGSTTNTAGTIDAAISAGEALVAMTNGATIVTGGFALCTNSRNNPVRIRIDTDSDCSNGTKREGVYILGDNTGNSSKAANNKWAFADGVAVGGNGNGTYDDGEDIFIESKKNALTYSAQADTNVYSTAGINNGKNLKDFANDCDKGGAGTQACKFTGTAPIDAADSIVIDEGTKGGAAPNNVVDKQADQLTGFAVENIGTATSSDFSELKLWVENGANPGFLEAEDTLLGTMTVGSTNKHWRIASLTQGIAAGGLRIYVTATTSATPDANNTLQLQIPQFVDASGDGVVAEEGDKGVFVASVNDGPTDGNVVNPNPASIIVPRKLSLFCTDTDSCNSSNGGGGAIPDSSTPVEESTDQTTDDTTTEEVQDEELSTPSDEVVEEPAEEVIEVIIVEPEPVIEEPPVVEQPPVIEGTPPVVDEGGEVLGLKVYAPGELIRGIDMKVYVVNDDGSRTHIRSLEELARDHFGKTIHDISQEVLDQYPIA